MRYVLLIVIHESLLFPKYSYAFPWPGKINGAETKGFVVSTLNEWRTSNGNRFHNGVDISGIGYLTGNKMYSFSGLDKESASSRSGKLGVDWQSFLTNSRGGFQRYTPATGPKSIGTYKVPAYQLITIYP